MLKKKKADGNLHAAGFSLGLLDIYNTSRNKENHIDYELRNQPEHCVHVGICMGTEILATHTRRKRAHNKFIFTTLKLSFS